MRASDILIEADESIHMVGAYDNSPDGKIKPDRYCALGLLRCKGGYYNGERNRDKAVEAFTAAGMTQLLGGKEAQHPITDEKNWHVGQIIVSLNDYHGWTFKQIGEWLRQYEE